MEKVRVEKTKSMKLAYIEHVGAYDRVPWDDYMAKLFSWAKEHKVRPGFKSVGIYYDNPEHTSPEQCRSDIAIPIKGDASPDGDIKVKEVPVMEVAVTKHKGPASQIGETYAGINKWIEENGYEWAGPSMEIYGKKPKVVGNEVILHVAIQVPVRKK